MFLCLHCSGEYERLNDEELACALRISADELTRTREIFRTKGFLDEANKIKQWDKRQYKSDASYERVKRHRQRRKEAGLPQQQWIHPQVREQVFQRDGHACVACHSSEDITIDHIVSELHGGTSDAENLQTLCRVCNAKKRDSDHETFLKREANALRVREQRSDTEKKKKTPSESFVPQKRDAGPAERVFDHWRQEFRHPRAVLDAKRRKIIAAALASFDEATVCSAISGYKLSPHHMGENDQRTVYDDIGLFLRDVSHIERGLNFARAPPKPQMSAVERAREKLRNGNGNGRVVSEQFGGSSESGMGSPVGMLRRIPDQ
jgi:5-methylcytosine-specific restriction endonuclease McrA